MITAPVQTKVARRLRSERGVTLIHVAASIFILMGFSAFVLDHGVLMLSRGQAQNVADMAALAGGIARAIDEPDHRQSLPMMGLPRRSFKRPSIDTRSLPARRRIPAWPGRHLEMALSARPQRQPGGLVRPGRCVS